MLQIRTFVAQEYVHITFAFYLLLGLAGIARKQMSHNADLEKSDPTIVPKQIVTVHYSHTLA